KVEVNDGGPVVITTATAEFQLLPTGYVQAFLMKDGKKMSLDEPKAGEPNESDYLKTGGSDVNFVLDFSQAQVTEAAGKMGRGKTIVVPAHRLTTAPPAVERTLTLEAYDDFPNLLLTSAEYKNVGSGDVAVDQVVAQGHRFSAALTDGKIPAYDM